MATPSVLVWYRGECYRSDSAVHGPKTVKWTDGATASLEIAPPEDYITNVTELIVVANNSFGLSGSTLDISPWGLEASQKISMSNITDMYSLFANVGGRVINEGSTPLHLIRISFRPFIRLTFGDTFAVENSGGATSSLGAAADFMRITAMAHRVLAANE